MKTSAKKTPAQPAKRPPPKPMAAAQPSNRPATQPTPRQPANRPFAPAASAVPAANPQLAANMGQRSATNVTPFTPTNRTSLADLVANLPPPGQARDIYVSKLSPNQRQMVNRETDGALYSERTNAGGTGATTRGQEKQQTGPPSQASVDAYNKATMEAAAKQPRPTDMLENGQPGRGQFGDVGDAERGRTGAYNAQDAGYNPALDNATLNAINPTRVNPAASGGSAQQAIKAAQQQRNTEAEREQAIFERRNNTYNPPPTPPRTPAPPSYSYQAYTAPPNQLQTQSAYKVNMHPMAGYPSTPNPVNYQNRDWRQVTPQGGLTQQQAQQMEMLKQRQMQPVSIQRAPTPDLTNARNLGQQILANSKGPASPSLAAKYGSRPTAPSFMPAATDWRQAMR